MSKISPDEPAFPRDHRHEGHNGLTSRAYIATKVIAGLGDWTPYRDDGSAPDWTSMAAIRQRRAEWAVAQADALIAALNAEPGHDR